MPKSREELARIALAARVVLVAACALAVAFALVAGVGVSRAWAGDLAVAAGDGAAHAKYRQAQGTVYFSRSLDGKFAVSDGDEPGLLMANLPIDLAEICQVDLDKRGLGKYNCPAPAGADYDYECTALQLFVYVAEHYAADSSMEVTGGFSHAYIERFWGEDENMLYYVNGCYPLEGSGWGATCDTIVLADGDVVTNAHYTNWGFYSDPETGFHFFVQPGATYMPMGKYAPPRVEGARIEHTCKAVAGVPLEVRLVRATGDVSTGDDTSFFAEPNWAVYWGDEYDLEEWNGKASGWTSTDRDGKAAITFEQPGTYWVWVDGGFGTYGTDCEDSYVSSPAALCVEVLDSADMPQAVQDAREAMLALPAESDIAAIGLDDEEAVSAVQAAIADIDAMLDALSIEERELAGADAMGRLDDARQALDALTAAQDAAAGGEGGGSGADPGDQSDDDGADDARIDIAPARVSVAKAVYTGKAVEPAVAVRLGEKVLSVGKDFAVSYFDNVNAGRTAKVTVRGIGDYEGSLTKEFAIDKAPGRLAFKAKAAKKAVKVKRGKSLAAKKYLAVSSATGALSYKLAKAPAKIKKKLRVNARTGAIKVRKGCKKGAYTLKMRVASAASANYDSVSKMVKLKLKVK